MNSDLQQERRQYFRIEDKLSISYQLVDPEELDSRLERLQKGFDSDFTVMSGLAGITQSMSGVLRKIELSSPDISRYLKALDDKIDLLGRAFLLQNSELSEQAATAVNLSASGMAFEVPEQITPESMLELKLLLLPSFTGVLIYARVISCEPSVNAEESACHLVRVDFSHIRSEDQDVLIRHMLQRQGEMLRGRQGSVYSSDST